ncbi:hypothetical protein KNP414_07654 [Paenibacillus mucilaginosus KNP414]|uniref:Uncharacterized protein n=1 Tax=Paenibacillus mucilaginosus (strain KNP414) TaxID=1036673 RepID=F8FCP9_PAEMK|nr:hypothetical protein KNP414_07654 [Paenibacillus mucilaginosus KNP414]
MAGADMPDPADPIRRRRACSHLGRAFARMGFRYNEAFGKMRFSVQ